jgi:hypothetical protein
MLLGDFNVNVGREDIFKPTIWNESLYKISNDNGVRVVNFATSKNVIVKSRTIKSRRAKWTGHVARMGRSVMGIGYWWESQNERDR